VEGGWLFNGLKALDGVRLTPADPLVVGDLLQSPLRCRPVRSGSLGHSLRMSLRGHFLLSSPHEENLMTVQEVAEHLRGKGISFAARRNERNAQRTTLLTCMVISLIIGST